MDEDDKIEPIPMQEDNDVVGSPQISFQSDLHTDDIQSTNHNSLTDMKKEIPSDLQTSSYLRPVKRNWFQ